MKVGKRKKVTDTQKHRHTIVRRFFNWLLDPVLVINHSVGITVHLCGGVPVRFNWHMQLLSGSQTG